MSEPRKKVRIEIDKKSCKRCGICQGLCPQAVYSLAKDGSPEITNPERCTNCRLCDLRCPDFAITLEVLA
ncbi:MAG: 4Fe-4S dicluster domain-containing protein [Desulfitobacteriaceae bacterium]